MSDRCNQLYYPEAIVTRVLGDWNCAQCQNLNYAFRDTCNRCQNSKIPLPAFHSFLYLTAPTLEENQYTSEELEHPPPKFDFMNLPSISPFLREKFLQSRIEINPVSKRFLIFEKENQEETKPQVIVTEQPPVYLKHIKRPKTERVGDWICFKCSNLNFAFRKECNKCGDSKCIN